MSAKTLPKTKNFSMDMLTDMFDAHDNEMPSAIVDITPTRVPPGIGDSNLHEAFHMTFKEGGLFYRATAVQMGSCYMSECGEQIEPFEHIEGDEIQCERVIAVPTTTFVYEIPEES